MSKINLSHQINVLHLFEMIGGSSIQSHFWKKFLLGKSHLLIHEKPQKNTVIEYYKEAETLPRFRDVVKEGLKRCKNGDVDIVWIHQTEIVVPIFKLLTNKKVVLSYQGSDVNEPRRSKNPIRILCRSMADLIIYNQKDHLKKIITIRNVRKEYVVNAVDTDLFYPKDKPKKGTLAFISDNLDRKKTLELLKKFEDLTIIDRNDGVIPYNEMPKILNKYELMVDLKVTTFGLLVPTLSKIALQSLACGLKVYTFQNEMKVGLPDRHKPENVMKKLHQLFCEILDNQLTNEK